MGIRRIGHGHGFAEGPVGGIAGGLRASIALNRLRPNSLLYSPPQLAPIAQNPQPTSINQGSRGGEGERKVSGRGPRPAGNREGIGRGRDLRLTGTFGSQGGGAKGLSLPRTHRRPQLLPPKRTKVCGPRGRAKGGEEEGRGRGELEGGRGIRQNTIRRNGRTSIS